MARADPKSWKAPRWHKDWKNVDAELEALRDFAIAALESCVDIIVELNVIEEGYLGVDIIWSGTKQVEVYASVDTTGVDYALYFQSDASEKEYHFRQVADGIDILRGCMRTSRNW